MLEIRDNSAIVNLERVRILTELMKEGCRIEEGSRFLEILFDIKKGQPTTE